MLKLKRLVLVRHGHSENIQHSLIGGWSDAKLTELGTSQVTALAERLRIEIQGNYTLYSSDILRTKQTTEIISQALNISPRYTKDLRDQNRGIVTGMKQDEAEKYVQEVTYPLIDWLRYPESESLRECWSRIDRFMESFNETEEQVIIVSHGGPIEGIIKWWIGTLLSDFFKFGLEIGFASISILDTNKHGQRKIERINDMTHYLKIGLSNPIDL